MILTDTSQLSQSGLRIAPERFDSIDVVFAASKLVVMMMDSIMLIAIENQTAISTPAVGVHRSLAEDHTLDNGHQLGSRAVFDDFNEHLTPPHKKSDNGRFTSSTPAAFATDPPGTEVGLIHFNLTCHLGAFLTRKENHTSPKPAVDPLGSVAVYTHKPSRSHGWNVETEGLQQGPKNPLRNVRTFQVPVFHYLTDSYAYFGSLN
jgi:hypothetical protein